MAFHYLPGSLFGRGDVAVEASFPFFSGLFKLKSYHVVLYAEYSFLIKCSSRLFLFILKSFCLYIVVLYAEYSYLIKCSSRLFLFILKSFCLYIVHWF